MIFLVADVLSDLIFVQANGAYAVATRPKVITRQILGLPEEPSVDKNRRFPFELSYRVGDAKLGRDAQAHMHMVRQGMPFDQLQPKLLAQLTEDSANLLAAFFRYLGMNTTWYRQYQRTCAWLSHSRIGSPLPSPGGLGVESLLFVLPATPDRSNLFGSHRQRRWFNCWN